MTIPSLIKWSGGKRGLAQRIAKFAPAFHTYYEPFLGGASLMYLFGKPGSVGSDIYQPLIDFYVLVRDNPTIVIDGYRARWELLQVDFPSNYYKVRENFNQNKNAEDLLFLTRTCVNGLIRFNRSGEFNAPVHLSRRGMLPEAFSKIVMNWHEKIRGIEFLCGDYQETTALASSRDFIYLDPPYAGDKSRYISGIDLERLYKYLENLNSRQIKFALSFDGSRGNVLYSHEIPKELYRRKEVLSAGSSSMTRVLRGRNEVVSESLYMNY